MRRISAGATALAVGVAVMGAGGQSPTAPARAVVTAYYADLAAKNYAGACRLLSSAYIKLAGRALLRSGRDRSDASAAIARPTAANCGRVIGDVVAIEKVDIAGARAVRITRVRLVGKVATFKLANVPGVDGGSTRLSAVVTDAHGRWLITAFA
jgi:hypothetical protein